MSLGRPMPEEFPLAWVLVGILALGILLLLHSQAKWELRSPRLKFDRLEVDSAFGIGADSNGPITPEIFVEMVSVAVRNEPLSSDDAKSAEVARAEVDFFDYDSGASLLTQIVDNARWLDNYKPRHDQTPTGKPIRLDPLKDHTLTLEPNGKRHVLNFAFKDRGEDCIYGFDCTSQTAYQHWKNPVHRIHSAGCVAKITIKARHLQPHAEYCVRLTRCGAQSTEHGQSTKTENIIGRPTIIELTVPSVSGTLSLDHILPSGTHNAGSASEINRPVFSASGNVWAHSASAAVAPASERSFYTSLRSPTLWAEPIEERVWRKHIGWRNWIGCG